MATLSELRQTFESSPQCEFVSVDVFVQRMTGRECLVRSDEPSANLLGLLDESTGSRILIPAEELARRQRWSTEC